MIELTSISFNDFNGWNVFRKITAPDTIISGITMGRLNINAETELIKICDNYIFENNYSVNKLYLNKLQTELITKGYSITTELLIKLFNNYYNKLYDEIQEAINIDCFNLLWFNQKFNGLNKKLTNLKYLLSIIDNSYKKSDFSKTKYSFVNMVKNYISYNKIINQRYNKNDNNYYLYELFIDEIENNFDTEAILQLFTIYNFYNKFSYTVKTNELSKYFNEELKTKMVFTKKTSDKFLTRTLEIINKKIIDLKKISTSETDTEIKYIRNLLEITPKLCEKDIFMILYKNLLTKRLLNGSDPEVENEFLKSFDPQYDLDNYIKMKNQINDCKLNKKNIDHYRTLEVSNTSEKYKSINIDLLDRSCVDIDVYRSYDWDFTNQNTNIYNLPAELSIYLDIYKVYYADRYNEKIIDWQYDNCIGVLNIKTDKEYNIRMNIIQMGIYYSLNNSSKDINELAKDFNMPVSKLSIYLNSLLLAQLISFTDSTKTICCINTNFTYKDNNFAIINIYEKLLSKAMGEESKEQTKLELPSETIIKAKILQAVFKYKELNKDKLIDVCNNSFNIAIPSTVYEDIINRIDKISIDGRIIRAQISDCDSNSDSEFDD